MKTLTAQLRRRLQETRQQKGVTRAQLARQLNITPTTLRRWEEGETRSIPDEAWNTMACFLNTPPLSPRLQKLQTLYSLLPGELQAKLEREITRNVLNVLNEPRA